MIMKYLKSWVIASRTLALAEFQTPRPRVWGFKCEVIWLNAIRVGLPAKGGVQALEFHVYKYYLHWAPISINSTCLGLFGAPGRVLGHRARTLSKPYTVLL